MSSIKRKPIENILAGLEKRLAWESAAEFRPTFSAFYRHRSQAFSSQRVEKLCEGSRVAFGEAELSGPDTRDDEDASEASLATLFFFKFFI